jgi:hypothetical protein
MVYLLQKFFIYYKNFLFITKISGGQSIKIWQSISRVTTKTRCLATRVCERGYFKYMLFMQKVLISI